jgi:hypothetical protein
MIELHNEPFDVHDPERGGWAFVELLDHRIHAGFVREVTAFGVALCEILIPYRDRDGIQTVHVQIGASLYAIHPTTRIDCQADAPALASIRQRLQVAATDVDTPDATWPDDETKGEANG